MSVIKEALHGPDACDLTGLKLILTLGNAAFCGREANALGREGITAGLACLAAQMREHLQSAVVLIVLAVRRALDDLLGDIVVHRLARAAEMHASAVPLT